MKRNTVIFSFLISAGLLSACNSNQSKPGTDSTGHYVPTNPYRDTFATTSSYGNATTVDNSGSGGTKVAPAHPVAVTTIAAAPAVKADTAKAKVDTTKKK